MGNAGGTEMKIGRKKKGNKMHFQCFSYFQQDLSYEMYWAYFYFHSGQLLVANSVKIDENSDILLLAICSWNMRFSTKSSLIHKLLTF